MTTRGERGLKSDEISAAVVELVDAGVLSAGVTASRGVAARGPRAEIGMITALCESAIKRGGAELIVRGVENDAYHWQALTTQRWIWSEIKIINIVSVERCQRRLRIDGVVFVDGDRAQVRHIKCSTHFICH